MGAGLASTIAAAAPRVRHWRLGNSQNGWIRSKLEPFSLILKAKITRRVSASLKTHTLLWSLIGNYFGPLRARRLALSNLRNIEQVIPMCLGSLFSTWEFPMKTEHTRNQKQDARGNPHVYRQGWDRRDWCELIKAITPSHIVAVGFLITCCFRLLVLLAALLFAAGARNR
jgi:hypothetical protein